MIFFLNATTLSCTSSDLCGRAAAVDSCQLGSLINSVFFFFLCPPCIKGCRDAHCYPHRAAGEPINGLGSHPSIHPIFFTNLIPICTNFLQNGQQCCNLSNKSITGTKPVLGLTGRYNAKEFKNQGRAFSRCSHNAETANTTKVKTFKMPKASALCVK